MEQTRIIARHVPLEKIPAFVDGANKLVARRALLQDGRWASMGLLREQRSVSRITHHPDASKLSFLRVFGLLVVYEVWMTKMRPTTHCHIHSHDEIWNERCQNGAGTCVVTTMVSPDEMPNADNDADGSAPATGKSRKGNPHARRCWATGRGNTKCGG